MQGWMATVPTGKHFLIEFRIACFVSLRSMRNPMKSGYALSVNLEYVRVKREYVS